MKWCDKCEEQEAVNRYGTRIVSQDCHDELAELGEKAEELCEYCGAFIDENGMCLCEREM